MFSNNTHAVPFHLLVSLVEVLYQISPLCLVLSSLVFQEVDGSVPWLKVSILPSICSCKSATKLSVYISVSSIEGVHAVALLPFSTFILDTVNTKFELSILNLTATASNSLDDKVSTISACPETFVVEKVATGFLIALIKLPLRVIHSILKLP